jgi:hypothetical protein
MTRALAPSFPGAVVSQVTRRDAVSGTNRRARLLLAYGAGDGPASVFVKREGRWPNRLALLALRALENEALLYCSGAPLPLEHPAAYAAAVDRRRLAVVVVLEDVTQRGAQPHALERPLTPEQVASGCAGLARLHGAYWDRPRPRGLDFVGPWRLGRPLAPISWASLRRALHLLRKGGHEELLRPDLDAGSLERGFRRWATCAREGPQTLLHGDPHPGNAYALAGGATGFYDWQLVRSGSWVHDVGYFVISSLAVADRRAHERELLAGYLAELAHAGAPAPDRAEAWDRYRLTPVFGLGTWLHTLSGGGFQPARTCLVAIERFAAAEADRAAGH